MVNVALFSTTRNVLPANSVRIGSINKSSISKPSPPMVPVEFQDSFYRETKMMDVDLSDEKGMSEKTHSRSTSGGSPKSGADFLQPLPSAKVNGARKSEVDSMYDYYSGNRGTMGSFYQYSEERADFPDDLSRRATQNRNDNRV